MLLQDINPFVRQVITATLRGDCSDNNNQWLYAPDCRAYYILNGMGEITIENERYSLNSGCVGCFQAGTKYKWNVERIDYISVNFDYLMDFSYKSDSFHTWHLNEVHKEHSLSKIEFEDAKELNGCVFVANAASVEMYFRRLSISFHSTGSYRNEYVSSMLKTILIALLRLSDAAEPRGNDIVIDIMQYIQENYSDELNNETVAAAVSLSTSYATRLFKLVTGKTIHNYIIDYRMAVVKEQLVSTSKSVQEICFSAGFSDYPHFLKSFKRLTGKTPTEYRKSFLEKYKS